MQFTIIASYLKCISRSCIRFYNSLKKKPGGGGQKTIFCPRVCDAENNSLKKKKE